MDLNGLLLAIWLCQLLISRDVLCETRFCCFECTGANDCVVDLFQHSSFSIYLLFLHWTHLYWMFVARGTLLAAGGSKWEDRIAAAGDRDRGTLTQRAALLGWEGASDARGASQPRWAVSVAGGSEEGGGAVGLNFWEEATPKDDIGSIQWRGRRWGSEWEESVPRPRSKTIQLILGELNGDILARTQVFSLGLPQSRLCFKNLCASNSYLRLSQEALQGKWGGKEDNPIKYD